MKKKIRDFLCNPMDTCFAGWIGGMISTAAFCILINTIGSSIENKKNELTAEVLDMLSKKRGEKDDTKEDL